MDRAIVILYTLRKSSFAVRASRRCRQVESKTKSRRAARISSLILRLKFAHRIAAYAATGDVWLSALEHAQGGLLDTFAIGGHKLSDRGGL